MTGRQRRQRESGHEFGQGGVAFDAMEAALDAIPGVLGNGVFARRTADVILVGRSTGGVFRIVPHSDDDVAE